MKEADTQRAILDWLAAKHIFAMRMQTGATVAEYNGKKRCYRFGTPGCADILAFPQTGRLNSRGYITPTWVECKSSIGKQSALQKSFQTQVEEQGHRYVLARSVDDVQQALEGS